MEVVGVTLALRVPRFEQQFGSNGQYLFGDVARQE
jgi:hypothetical protein